MLAIFLKVLSILGIVLLAVLAVMLLGLVLVLFVPLTYRLSGSRDAGGLRLSVKLNWFFGLLRVRFRYPEPGRLTVKALCFPLFDMKLPPEKPSREDADSGSAASAPPPERKAHREAAGTAEALQAKTPSRDADGQAPKAADSSAAAEPSDAAPVSGTVQEGHDPARDSGTGPSGKVSQKIEGIKHTIHTFCDKIKEIRKNISYYMELLQEDNTKQLAAHAFLRFCRMMRDIRPRHIRVRLLFGTGSPDTTGYIYGAYCILSAPLGAGVCVTPDFQERRLEGEFDIAGHVIAWTFLINGLKLVLDKKLRIFLKRLKAGREKLRKAPA